MKFMYFFKILKINFKKMSFIIFFIIVFYEIFIKLGSIFYLQKVFTGNFYYIAQPSKLIIYIPILNIWRFFVFIIIFHVFVISFCMLINICPLIPFSSINNISISVKISNFTLVFLKAACHWKKFCRIKFIYFKTYFEGFRIHQLIVMYRSERTNHDILLNFLF